MFEHITVMKNEAVEGLSIRPDGVYVDCTLGGAGHSQLIASQLGEQGLLIAFDQDEQAIEEAKRRLEPYGERVKIVRSNFRYIRRELAQIVPVDAQGVPKVDGILFDLGVSSPQLDQADRGFSYNHDAPLDMRMDQSASFNAYTLVNEWAEADIAKILFQYGEEKFARRIAGRIIREREKKPIETTGELTEIIKEGIPAAARRTGSHPAKRSFQAIRIAVNDELGAFEQALADSMDCLHPNGRLSVITFHSLEDRICKTIVQQKMESCICPPDLPMCACDRKPTMRWVKRKPILPSEGELADNPRARSAKLRVAEKL